MSSWKSGDSCFADIAEAIECGDLSPTNVLALHDHIPTLIRCVARVTGLGRNFEQFLDRTDPNMRDRLTDVIKNVTGIEPKHDLHLFELIREHRTHMDRLRNGEVTDFRLKKVGKFTRYASEYFT